MIKVLVKGTTKTYYTKCHHCGSELEYKSEDATTEEYKNIPDAHYIICPECNKILFVCFETKEDFHQRFAIGKA